MKTKLTPNVASTLLLLSTVTTLYVAQLQTAYAQGTAFTYQGRLGSGGNPANGFFDITFSMWTNASGPAQVGATVTTNAVAVSNGLFTVALDFGNQFPGADRWLEIGVRTNGGGAFATLAPRQKLTPTPYAITSSSLSGTLANSALPTGGNWPLSTTLTLDTSTLVIDPVNNRVGIGTSFPARPLTVATGQGYGIEHTDGSRRLSTYLDSGGCYFGSVSPDSLNFFVNDGVSSLTIDLSGRVGIGTGFPSWPLHVVAAQSVARLDSTANTFGSVLELRNNTASPSTLGAINFNNSAATYPGQIAYTGTDALAFRTAGAERMRLDNGGKMTVTGAASSVELNTADTVILPLPRGVKATCDSILGTAVFGVSQDGNAISGSSANGWAGNFSGAVRISGDSSHSKPFLQLHETQDGDYARIQLSVASRPVWHVSVGGANNSLVFYNSSNSIVTSISENGILSTKVLTITGGADIAEPFPMTQADLPKGAVVVIDEQRPGHLKLSTEPYDRRVAGIISGAGGVNPGLSLQQQGVLEGGQAVALTGRVHVQADTTNGPIKPGDLLTTSVNPGHAMKVTDHTRAQGAILGKAMTGLTEGKGLVLVLVTLQ